MAQQNNADVVRLGPEAKVDLSGIAFAVTGGDYTVSRAVVNRTDTESVAIRSKASPLRELHSNLELQQADDGGYHVAPLQLTKGADVWLRIWPAGRNDPAGPVDVPHFIVGTFNGNFRVEGSPVQGVRLSGQSDNAIFLPGE